MKRILFLLIGLILILAFALVFEGYAQTAPTLSLNECVQEAIDNSNLLQMRRLQVQAQNSRVQTSSAQRLPTLGFNGSYRYVSETMSLELPSTLPIQIPAIEFGDGNVYELALMAEAPLYAGGRLKSRMAAEQAALQSSRYQVRTDSLTLMLQVRQAFYLAAGAEAEVRSAQLSQSRLERARTELEGMIAAGLASQEMLVQVDARMQLVLQRIAAAEMEAQNARFQLGQLVGQPDTEIAPQVDIEQSLLTGDAPGMAIENRPEMLSLQADRSRVSALERAARGSYWPTVAARAGYIYGKPGINQIENEWMGYATAGISLNWTLWDFSARRHQVQEVRVQESILEEQTDAVRDQITSAQVRASANLETARRVLELSGSRVELEGSYLQHVQARSAQGQATRSEWLDAEDNLREAEIALVQARTRLRLAEAAYLKAIGR